MKRNWAVWGHAAGIRAVKTVAQTAAGILASATVLGEVEWGMVLSASLLAGFLSVLTSIAGLPEEHDTADGEGE
jgi:hypothetical protein